jgi:two-component system, NtrC family, sensor kinase
MDENPLLGRYRELQSYVGWTEPDAERIVAAAGLLDPFLPGLIDDFYAVIEQHPAARRVITGGQVQIDRLKGTLVQWIRELLGGEYDDAYVARRWRIGWRHVEIGLDQVYTNVALSRLRTGLIQVLHASWQLDDQTLQETARALNKILDLDLAIIEDAYHAEYLARLQRTERMAVLGRVGGGVAHELLNPLNVIQTSVYYLLNAAHPTPEKNVHHLKRIERNVAVAHNVITSLTSFAMVPLLAPLPIAIGRLVRETLESNPLGDGIDVTVDLPVGLPHALGDFDQLRIALGNLIRNSRDAMSARGRLVISAVASDGVVELSVTDTGVGIEKSDLTMIMEPLYSTKASGLGLGLTISRSIVEKNQGSLRVTSEPGRGSTFTIRLFGSPSEGAKP